ncbi:NAD(P)H-dependent oxidoreductase [Actinokineospora globicatena]|uniref:NAD(P)H-dependent oxidoreductase n=1 Tax=Actinokineospora globicatena TaxID=103729 RepID=UPI0020A56D57|nr:NAD(P)H-dependent oxidoreductase [Actinokineospora globicatena]MCP2303171.1 NAD(P)H dehydrogenase (quinone) [Actinokineospora globicatena]GLW79712.1 trp repressor-binding protein WrbA [Actinokineospora globicatena]GLW85878.1 trp repressor-binding protein WrbA [Actinokineospora globicatena]
MTKLAVVYYSATGNIHKLAVAAAAAGEAAGAEVRLRRAAEITDKPLAPNFAAWAEANVEHVGASRDVAEATIDDLDWADAVLWGSPGRYGLIAGPLKHFIDQTFELHARRGLVNKVMSSFTSTGSAHGGQESTILSLNTVFYHWGAVIVAPGVIEDIMLAPSNGNPYGVSATSGLQAVPGGLAGNVTEDNVAAIGFQTRRVLQIASALRVGLAADSTE